MEILISEQTNSGVNGLPITGYSITFVNRNKKKTMNEQDFFTDGSEIEAKVQQLKRLLKQYFDAQV
jgi:hypothetical protein